MIPWMLLAISLTVGVTAGGYAGEMHHEPDGRTAAASVGETVAAAPLETHLFALTLRRSSFVGELLVLEAYC